MSTQPSEHAILDDIATRTFFTKLAELGHPTPTEAEAVLMMQIGVRSYEKQAAALADDIQSRHIPVLAKMAADLGVAPAAPVFDAYTVADSLLGGAPELVALLN